MGEERVVFIHSGVLPERKKNEWNPNIYNKIDADSNVYPRWNKLDG